MSAMKEKTKNNLQTAAFGAGCFWGVEEAFMHVKVCPTISTSKIQHLLKN